VAPIRNVDVLMPALARTCAIALACALAAWSFGAAAQDRAWQEPAALREAAERLAREQNVVPGQSVYVKAAVDEQLRLPGCGQPPRARPVHDNGSSMTVELSCAGPSAWTLFVVVQVSRQAEVLVLNRALRAGESLTADAVGLRRREVSGLGHGALRDPAQAVGRTARRALAAGTILDPAELAEPRLVRRGQVLTLVGRAGGLVVRADGKAMADGAAGDYIPVENLASRRVVRARVRSGQEADVDL
jgi:flagellar basal body P-ring formation protein FlgA